MSSILKSTSSSHNFSKSVFVASRKVSAISRVLLSISL